MMALNEAGFWMESSRCGRKVQDVAYIRVMSSVQQLGGCGMQVTHWNTGRIMMAIGLGNSLLNRYLDSSPYHLGGPLISEISIQLKEKIIPAFEHAHGAGYQMLLMVDNSQGHSAYAKDALLTSRMNMNPGGKQACL